MATDNNIGADTSGRTTDIGGSRSGGDAANVDSRGLGKEVLQGDNPVSPEEAEQADTEQLHGIPDDLKPGKRRTVGLDEDAGAGEPVVSGTPGSTTGGG